MAKSWEPNPTYVNSDTHHVFLEKKMLKNKNTKFISMTISGTEPPPPPKKKECPQGDLSSKYCNLWAYLFQVTTGPGQWHICSALLKNLCRHRNSAPQGESYMQKSTFSIVVFILFLSLVLLILK